MSVKRPNKDDSGSHDPLSSTSSPKGQMGDHEVKPVKDASGFFAWISEIFAALMESLFGSKASAQPEMGLEEFGADFAKKQGVNFYTGCLDPGDKDPKAIAAEIQNAAEWKKEANGFQPVFIPMKLEDGHLVLLILDFHKQQFEYYDPELKPIEGEKRKALGINMMPRSLVSVFNFIRGYPVVSHTKRLHSWRAPPEMAVIQFMQKWSAERGSKN